MLVMAGAVPSPEPLFLVAAIAIVGAYFLPASIRWVTAFWALFLAMAASLFYIPYTVSCHPHTGSILQMPCSDAGTIDEVMRLLRIQQDHDELERREIHHANETERFARPWMAYGDVLALRTHSYAEVCKLRARATVVARCSPTTLAPDQLAEVVRAKHEAGESLYSARVDARLKRPLYYQVMEDPLLLPRCLVQFLTAYFGFGTG